MKYVALLRGINVGGNAKVSMATLKTVFESVGCKEVRTYINSGNVLFEATGITEGHLEKAIEKEFGFHVPVVLMSKPALETIAQKVPDHWMNNEEMKTDVLFLWPEVDTSDVLNDLKLTDIDEVVYVPGALLWRVDRKHISKSGLLKVVGTPFYKQVTVRNVNTLRKLVILITE